jgi:hypothetical protein
MQKNHGSANSSNPITIINGDKQHWAPLLMSSLSLLITPILVSIITYNSSQSSVNKDYVSIAVSVLNSKDSTQENRKWALRLLTNLSPVPFSEESQKQLANGSGLTAGPIKIMPMYGPKNPLIKKSSSVTKPCQPVLGPDRPWAEKDMKIYIEQIGKSYAECAKRHELALAFIDILQQTDSTDAALYAEIKPKSYPVYHIK